MGESLIAAAEERIGNRAVDGVRFAGVEIGIEQREFAVDGGGVAGEFGGAGDFEGDAGGGDDVVDGFLQSRFAEKIGEGAGDLAVEFAARNFFDGGSFEMADIFGGDVAAAGVVVGDGAR